MAFHDALETFTFGSTCHVDEHGVVEDLNGDGVAEVVLLVELELGQVLFWCCAGFLEDTHEGFGGVLLLSLAESELIGAVTIILIGLHLSHDTRTSFDNSARHVFAVGTENGCHSDFSSY